VKKTIQRNKTVEKDKKGKINASHHEVLEIKQKRGKKFVKDFSTNPIL
jgi:hypothetical protein